MLEMMIETWTHPGRAPAYRWSLWADGIRVAMGGPHETPAESEAEAQQYCGQRMKRPPDRITRL